jgi:hypothetical protein
MDFVRRGIQYIKYVFEYGNQCRKTHLVEMIDKEMYRRLLHASSKMNPPMVSQDQPLQNTRSIHH